MQQWRPELIQAQLRQWWWLLGAVLGLAIAVAAFGSCSGMLGATLGQAMAAEDAWSLCRPSCSQHQELLQAWDSSQILTWYEVGNGREMEFLLTHVSWNPLSWQGRNWAGDIGIFAASPLSQQWRIWPGYPGVLATPQQTSKSACPLRKESGGYGYGSSLHPPTELAIKGIGGGGLRLWCPTDNQGVGLRGTTILRTSQAGKWGD